MKLENGPTAHLPSWLRRFVSKPLEARVEAGSFSSAQRQQLLSLAWLSLREGVLNRTLPAPETTEFPPRFLEPRGCFVTLMLGGELRGCVGQIFPQHPLYLAVMRNAQSAAMRDFRFPPVTPEELPQIQIELSVLSAVLPVESSCPNHLLEQLKPGRDGVVLKLDGRTATFLPQVWEHYGDKEEFLNLLCEKAGGAAWDWRKPEVDISTYTVEHFSESEVNDSKVGI